MEKEILLKEYSLDTSEDSGTFFISIREKGSTRHLSFRGSPEMLLALKERHKGKKSPVILIHKVLLDMANTLEVTIKKLLIYDMIKGVCLSRFYVETLSGEEKILEIETRDALVLALKADIPLYAYESIFEKALEQYEYQTEWWNLDTEFMLDKLNRLSDEDIFRYSPDDLEKYLEKVVEAEKYELAARLKDIIYIKKNKNDSSC